MTNKVDGPLEFSFTGEVQKMALKPGDVLLLKTPLPIDEATATRLRKAVEHEFPGHKCLVLGDDLDLCVMERRSEMSGVTATDIELNAEQMRREFGVEIVNHFHISGPADKRTQEQIAVAAARGIRSGCRA